MPEADRPEKVHRKEKFSLMRTPKWFTWLVLVAPHHPGQRTKTGDLRVHGLPGSSKSARSLGRKALSFSPDNLKPPLAHPALN